MKLKRRTSSVIENKIYKDFDIIWHDADTDNGFISKWFINTPTFQLVKTTNTKKEAFEFVDNYLVDGLTKWEVQ